jgi:hypothetical protein
MDSGLAAELEGRHLHGVRYERFPAEIDLMFYWQIEDGRGLIRILRVTGCVHFTFSRTWQDDDPDPDWHKYADVVLHVEELEDTEAALYERGAYYFRTIEKKAAKKEPRRLYCLRLNLTDSMLDVVTRSRADIRWLG